MNRIRVFTPNNDGVNDRFTLFTSDDANTNIVELVIFDRWGGKVFEARDFQPGDLSAGWDGSNNGQLLNPGVYVFSAVLETRSGDIEMASGDVTLVR